MNSNQKIAAAISVFIICLFLAGKNATPRNPIEPEPKSAVSEFVKEKQVAYFFDAVDTSEILKVFFENGELAGKNLIRWKPDLEEKLQMNVAPDGYCYTSLDTIIDLEIHHSKKMYVFLTKNYNNDMTIDECHSCAPNYSLGTALKTQDSMMVENFKKNVFTAGSFGEKGNFEMLDVDGNHSFIKITSGWLETTSKTEYVNLFDPFTFKHVLGYEAYRSDEMAISNQFFAEENLQEVKTELRAELNEKGQYELILARTETGFDTIQEKVLTHYSTKVYRWNSNNDLELCYE